MEQLDEARASLTISSAGSSPPSGAVKDGGGVADQNGVWRRRSVVTGEQQLQRTVLVAAQAAAAAVPAHVQREFFSKEPSDYTHPLFIATARVFSSLRHDREEAKDGSARPAASDPADPANPGDPGDQVGSSKTERTLVFALVFETLKYQQFLEDVLEEINFFQLHTNLCTDSSLVLVILSELRRRHFKTFSSLPEDEHNSERVLAVQQALAASRTRIKAAIARSRIEARVDSINALLPAVIRHSDDSINSKAHLTAWINRCKAKELSTLEMLGAEGFRAVGTLEELDNPHRRFVRDRHCHDLLHFSSEHRAFLEAHRLIQDARLVVQDKSSVLGPHSVFALLNAGDDVLLLNAAAGATAAHIVSLTYGSGTSVIAFGASPKAAEYLSRLGADSRVTLIRDNFLDVNPSDDRVKRLKVALLSAECSRTGVSNPVNFIVNEGEDMSILKTLSREQTSNSLAELVYQHGALLKHALRLPRMQAVVYCTRSTLAAENDHVVTHALEHANTLNQKAGFRVSPPVLPLSPADIERLNAPDNGVPGGDGRFLRFPSSSDMAGCFLATITREAADPQEAAKNILSRAAAKGILNGMPQDSKSGGAVARPRRRASNKGSKGKLKRASPVRRQEGSAVSKAATGRDSPRKAGPRVPAHMIVVKHPQPFR